jgi:cobalt-zinc-cadmium efflux system membrane fusion protein
VKRSSCRARLIWIAATAALVSLLASCTRETKAAPTKEEVAIDPNVFETDHPELFKTTKVASRQMPTVLTANGTITPDVNRTIHVTSLGGGRVAELKVKLGDAVQKGQTLLIISSPDLASAFSDYQKAVADEQLSKRGLDRAQLLYEKGAIAEKDLQTAQDAEQKALVDVRTTEQRLRVLGGDPAHPSSMLDLRAPISGTIVEQNVAGFEGIKSLDNTPNLFTIADLSQVWVVCDVFENDLGDVHIGDPAEIRLNAFPERILKGTITDISRVLDPATRTAKVRIVLRNGDGQLRPGMFAVATFRSRKTRPGLVVPGTAVMRLHDKDWIFRHEGNNRYRRVEVQVSGATQDGMQEIRSGVNPDDEIVLNALDFSTAIAEKKE